MSLSSRSQLKLNSNPRSITQSSRPHGSQYQTSTFSQSRAQRSSIKMFMGKSDHPTGPTWNQQRHTLSAQHSYQGWSASVQKPIPRRHVRAQMGAQAVLEDGTEVKTPDNVLIDIDPVKNGGGEGDPSSSQQKSAEGIIVENSIDDESIKIPADIEGIDIDFKADKLKREEYTEMIDSDKKIDESLKLGAADDELVDTIVQTAKSGMGVAGSFIPMD